MAIDAGRSSLQTRRTIEGHTGRLNSRATHTFCAGTRHDSVIRLRFFSRVKEVGSSLRWRRAAGRGSRTAISGLAESIERGIVPSCFRNLCSTVKTDTHGEERYGTLEQVAGLDAVVCCIVVTVPERGRRAGRSTCIKRPRRTSSCRNSIAESRIRCRPRLFPLVDRIG